MKILVEVKELPFLSTTKRMKRIDADILIARFIEVEIFESVKKCKRCEKKVERKIMAAHCRIN